MTKLSATWLARLAVTRRGACAIALACSIVSVLTASLVFLAAISWINEKTLHTIDAQLLRRAELTFDYAFIALGDLSERGYTSCDAAALAEFRKTIYRYSAIKDIRVIDSSNAVACSAFPETLVSESVSTNDGNSLPALNHQISLFRVEQSTGAEIGIRWTSDDKRSLVAIVSASSLLFDILPQDLRENGTSSLSLADGRVVAVQDTDDTIIASKRLRRVSLRSQRYPLIASIGIDMGTLDQTNQEPLVWTVLLFAAIGLVFGIMAAKISAQSAGPVAEIDAALARNEFVPFIQPIFSLNTRKIVGAEVLARWRRSDGSLVPPDQFIKVAEESGRIVPLTWHLATSALTALRKHLSADRQFKIAFNITPTQLLSSDFTHQLREIAVNAGVSPRQIVVEITERQEITDLQKASVVLAELRHRGFRIAFDDVGTGHNGLSYLQKLGADIIKIDKLFIDSIATSRPAKVLVEMLVNVARELNMTTVAEGVETEEQVVLLKECGVSQGQGYLVSRPLPVSAFLDLVDSFAYAQPASSIDAGEPLQEAMIA
jgi:sensor c-di-GMP phosphodiesterase-like protein